MTKRTIQDSNVWYLIDILVVGGRSTHWTDRYDQSMINSYDLPRNNFAIEIDKSLPRFCCCCVCFLFPRFPLSRPLIKTRLPGNKDGGKLQATKNFQHPKLKWNLFLGGFVSGYVRTNIMHAIFFNWFRSEVAQYPLINMVCAVF